AGIVLPPSLGVDRPRSQALSERVGVPCGEPIAMPGGPAGLRFERARDRAFATAGITRARARVRRAEASGGTWHVTGYEGTSFEAHAVVLATGGLIGGGIEYAPSEATLAAALPSSARAPFRASVDAPVVLGAHGRPLELPGSLFGVEPERLAWPFTCEPTGPTGPFTGGGMLERAGVLVAADRASPRGPPAGASRFDGRSPGRPLRAPPLPVTHRFREHLPAHLQHRVRALLRIFGDVARLDPRGLDRRRPRAAGDDDHVLRRRRRARRFAREMTVEVLLAIRDAALVLRHLHGDVRMDTVGLDRASVRRVVARDRQSHARPAGQRDDRLHAPLAERRLPDHRRALLILERPCHQLRRAGR